MKPQDVDYTLYLVTDRNLARGRVTRDIVAAGVRGGVTCVQLREKTADTREFIREAAGLKDLLAASGIPLIINDRLDVALAVGADGVHLGQKDMPLEMARAIAGDRLLIGISVESLADALEAEKGGADYLGVSPIYATPTKTDTAAALGLNGLAEIRRHVRLPLVAIGGLKPENAGGVVRSGADGIAVVSAIVAADDPERAAREMHRMIVKARERSI